MKIFQATLLAAAVSAIQLADGELDELKGDLKADLGITDADIAAFEALPPKDQKKMLKEMAADLGEDGEGLVDDVKQALDLELGEEGEKPEKKGEKPPPKGDDDGDMTPPCSEDDDECWEEAEKMLRKEMKDAGVTEADVEAALELGEDGDKPAKKGEKPPPKGEDDGDMTPPCSEDDDECWEEAEKMLRKEMKDAGVTEEDLEAALELGEDGDKPAPKGDKPPKKGEDDGDMTPPCSDDDDECWEEVEQAIRKEMKDAGMTDGEIDDALDASMDLEDLEGLETAQQDKKKPKKEQAELAQKKQKKEQPAAELAQEDKPEKKEKKAPKKEGEGEGLEAEAADAIREFDADGSGRISKEEGEEVLKAVGFSEDVAGMIAEGLGEELDEEPTPEEIVDGAKELGEFIARKEGVSEDDLAAFVDDIDFSKVTKDDVEEFVAYLEEGEE